MRIMVAYDGSSCADSALCDLHRAGLPREAEALVISVAERWLPRPPVSRPAEFGAAAGVAAAEAGEDVDRAYHLASEAKSRLESHFTTWKVEVAAASGSPAREILNRASSWRPDLIVLGCQGRSALGRFLLGSVSQKVLNEAKCSVRICRGTAWKEASPVRIVIGLDGSASSKEAVKSVANRAWPIGSEVRLVTVIDPSKSITKEGSSPPAWQDSWVGPFIDNAEQRLRAVELNVSTKVEVGDPKTVLVADANEWGADCIVMGAAASPSASTLGGVSTAVVTRAHCSVEIIRPSK
jgi:nucleotide-binding universal stress UspA family protein